MAGRVCFSTEAGCFRNVDLCAWLVESAGTELCMTETWCEEQASGQNATALLLLFLLDLRLQKSSRVARASSFP